MSGRLDPPHDRLSLTNDERRAMAAIEASFRRTASDAAVVEPGALGSPGWRYGLLAVCFRLVRLGPWLVPVGVVLALWALPNSVVLSTIGSLITLIGLAACARVVRRRWTTRRPSQPEDH